MKTTLYLLVLSSLVLTGMMSAKADGSGSWEAPFDSSAAHGGPGDSVLTLDDVLNLVASENRTLRALALWPEIEAGRLKQAGAKPNPELGIEVEEAGWDAPGLKESEITISLAQEFEIFGQPGARRRLVQAESGASALEAKFITFDLYLQVKQRFCALLHAQEQLELSATSVELAGSIVENIRFKIDKGVGLQSELLLAQMEQQRAELRLEQARREVGTAQVELAVLWNGTSTEFRVFADFEPRFPEMLNKVGSMAAVGDSSRGTLQLGRQQSILRAEQSLARAEAKPTVTLSGGFKRLEADNSHSFLFGFSLPLPFFNRNQGTRLSLESQAQSLDYEIARAQQEAIAALRVNTLKLRELMERHRSLDSLLLPTAEEAYRTLQSAYEAGRIPYTQLLEAERSLNELRFEHNDMLLEICEQFIAWEAITGVTLPVGKEK